MREPAEILGPVRPSRRAEFPGEESVAWASPRFTLWTGPSPGSTYGGKAILDHNSQPAFAELAIVRRLREADWGAVWVSQSFGRLKFRDAFWGSPPEPKVPRSVVDLLASVADARKGSYQGTWDVVAWPLSIAEPTLAELRFLESKREGRDAIKREQVEWFNALRSKGALNSAFLVVEWTLADADT